MALSQQEFDEMDSIVEQGNQLDITPYEPDIPQAQPQQQPLQASVTKWANIIPTHLAEQGTRELGARIWASRHNMPIEEARNDFANKYAEFSEEHPILTGTGAISSKIKGLNNWLLDQYLYGGMNKAMNGGAVGLGAITSGFEATRHGKNPLTGALTGAGLGFGLQNAFPFLNQGIQNVQQKILQSEKYKDIIEALAGVPKAITERLIKKPQILKTAQTEIGKRTPEKYYSETMEEEAQRAFKKLKEVVGENDKAIANYIDKNKNTTLDITKQELAQIFDNVFKRHSSGKFDAYKEAPSLAKRLQGELTGKQSDLKSLHNLKKELQSSSHYGFEGKAQSSPKYTGEEAEIAKDLAYEINQVLRRQHPEYARLNDIGRKYNLFQDEARLTSANIGNKFRAYGNPNRKYEEDILNQLNELLPSENKFVDKILDAQTANMFLQKDPIRSTTEQILTRKALPYAGMAVTGSNPIGFMSGILTAGRTSNPSRYGQQIINMSENLQRNPNILTPERYNTILNINRGSGNIIPYLLPKEQQER